MSDGLKLCRTCRVRKPAEDFLPSINGFVGRSCESCLEATAWEMNEKRRLATTYKRGGRWYRVCKLCGEHKPLSSGFYTRKGCTGKSGHESRCKPCFIAQTRLHEEHRHEDPEKLAIDRARNAAHMKRRAEENPEREREARKRYWQRLKADPERYAKQRENGRINHRLRRERAGLSVGSPRRQVVKVEEVDRIPSKPLADFINARIAEREAVERFIGEDMRKAGSKGAICDELRVHPRNLYAWTVGERETVLIGTAEAVLLHADVTWGDVYPYDDHADLYETVLAGLV